MFSLVGATLYLSFVDDGGSRSELTAHLPLTVSWSTANAFASAIAAAAQSISTASLDSYRITLRAFDQAATDAQAGSVHDGAAFIYEVTPGERWLHFIPAFDPLLYETTGPFAGINVDQTAAAVQLLTNLVLTGDGTIEPISRFGGDLTQLNAAYRQYR